MSRAASSPRHASVSEGDLGSEQYRPPRWLEETCQRLLKNESLAALNLAGKQIGPHGAVLLAQALYKNTSLQKLILRKNSIGNGGMDAIAEALCENSVIEELDVSLNDVENVEAVGTMLQRNNSLKKLYLWGNGIGGTTNMGAIAEGLQVNDVLQNLGLCDCGIGSNVSLLGPALHQNSTLKVLDISRNEIESYAIVTLLQGLMNGTHSALRVLNLKYNYIVNDGAAVLGQVLQHNTTLKTIYLSFNPIGRDGAIAIAQGLAKNTTLKQLEMYGIAIQKEGAVALRDALQTKNRTLQGFLVHSHLDYDLEEEQIDLYCDLNKAGRRFVHDVTLPWSLWPFILAKVGYNADLLFEFIREKPDLFQRDY